MLNIFLHNNIKIIIFFFFSIFQYFIMNKYKNLNKTKTSFSKKEKINSYIIYHEFTFYRIFSFLEVLSINFIIIYQIKKLILVIIPLLNNLIRICIIRYVQYTVNTKYIFILNIINYCFYITVPFFFLHEIKYFLASCFLYTIHTIWLLNIRKNINEEIE